MNNGHNPRQARARQTLAGLAVVITTETLLDATLEAEISGELATALKLAALAVGICGSQEQAREALEAEVFSRFGGEEALALARPENLASLAKILHKIAGIAIADARLIEAQLRGYSRKGGTGR